jgi:shikimate dehydrogenase
MSVPYAEVIGDPIAHSKSPLIHNFWLARTKTEGAYRAAHVLPNALAAYFEARRRDPYWRGCSVTMPHKMAVGPLIASHGNGSPINCIVRESTGLGLFNFDIDALIDIVPSGTARVALIGSGGAAMATVEALSGRKVAVIARDPDKARRLEELGSDGYVAWYPFDCAANALADAEGLINATPLGMRGAEPMPASVLDGLHLLRDEAFVFDMVYDPPRTNLLERAARSGIRTIDGFTMLVAQAALAFEKFFAVPAPREHDAELRELLTR